MTLLHPPTAPSLCSVVRVSRRPGFYLLSIGCFHTRLAVFSEDQASAGEPAESAAGDLLPAGRRDGGVGVWWGMSAPDAAHYSSSTRKLAQQIN